MHPELHVRMVYEEDLLCPKAVADGEEGRQDRGARGHDLERAHTHVLHLDGQPCVSELWYSAGLRRPPKISL